MVNLNNLCRFEGRMVKDVQVQKVGQGQNQYSKVLFTIAVDRNLSKDQRQAKQQGQDVVSADYPQFVATGAVADLIANYFPKGKPISILAQYQSYKKQDPSGNTIYGHIFKVESAGFTVSDTSGNNNNSGNYNNNSNGGNHNNNGGNYNNFNNQPVDDNFYGMDQGDIPF